MFYCQGLNLGSGEPLLWREESGSVCRCDPPGAAARWYLHQPVLSLLFLGAGCTTCIPAACPSCAASTHAHPGKRLGLWQSQLPPALAMARSVLQHN